MAFLHGNKRRREAFIAILAVLALALVMLGYAQNQRVAALTTQVVSVYQKALFETAELMSGVQLNLEKLMVSGSASNRQTILGDIARQADAARDNLAILPQGQAAMDGAIKFANQVSDLTQTLSERLASGGTLSNADTANLKSLHEGCVLLNGQLATALLALEKGELTFDLDQSRIREIAQRQERETEPTVDYPVLLYDGPFSDGADTGPMRVSGEDVDEAEAARRLSQYIGAERVASVRQVGESNLQASCYEFELETESGRLFAGVTKTGGHVLYMLPDSQPGARTISDAECIDLAARFLQSRGYPDMQVSYWRRQENILTVNFAATQGEVILYPDLVKLQVNMDNGMIIGVEAANYLRNHRARALPIPLLSEDMALTRLNPALTVERARLCVIPLDSGEAQCWEVLASFPGGGSYLIYLDANTGEEKTILQIVEDGEGVVTQ